MLDQELYYDGYIVFHPTSLKFAIRMVLIQSAIVGIRSWLCISTRPHNIHTL
jgi:hypothetical protein